MAEGNVIDSLELKVKSDANSAIANLGKLQTQLRHTAKSIGTVQAAVNSLNRVDMTFKKLGQVNVGNLSSAITQLERLSKINLKNFDGKTIGIKFEVSGADDVVRQKQAVQKALENIDVKTISKKFSDSLALSKADAKKVQSTFQQAFQDVASGKGANDAFVGWMRDLEKNGASVLKESYVGAIDQIKKEYDTLVKYLKDVKIKPPAETGKLGGRSLEDYGLTSIDRSRYFSANGKSIDSIWGDMLEPQSGMNNLLQGLEKIEKEEDQIIALFERMKYARDLLADGKTIKISDLDESNQHGFWESAVTGAAEQAHNVEMTFAKAVDDEMRRSADKIPLNVDIDPERIGQQIRNAVKEASKVTYDLPIKIQLPKQDLQTQVKDAIGSIDPNGVGKLGDKLGDLASSLASMSRASEKGNGLGSFVSAMRRLTNVDLSKINVQSLNEIVESINKIAQIGDISATISRLVSSLAKLASAGVSTRITAKSLPMLGDNLKSLVGDIGTSGAIPDQLNSFVSSLARLATAGDKANVSANNLRALGSAVRAFIDDVTGAGNVSDSILRMTEAIAQIANSGSKAGSAARSMGKSISRMGDDSQKAYNRIEAIASIMRDLVNVFKKAGNYVRIGASKIINALKSIKKEGNGLQTATQSIKNMIGAMVGFRGITGIGNLLKQTIMLGADLTEIDHIVESVFGDMTSTVDQWAKDAITNFGIAEHSAKRYAGTLSAMFQASNIGYMDAGKMSMDLVGLAGDLSAFYNIDTETAFNKIRSGMAGMVRPLRKQHCAYVQKCA